MELAFCCPSGTWNFEVAPGYLKNLCNPVTSDAIKGISLTETQAKSMQYFAYGNMLGTEFVHCRGGISLAHEAFKDVSNNARYYFGKITENLSSNDMSTLIFLLI